MRRPLVPESGRMTRDEVVALVRDRLAMFTR